MLRISCNSSRWIPKSKSQPSIKIPVFQNFHPHSWHPRPTWHLFNSTLKSGLEIRTSVKSPKYPPTFREKEREKERKKDPPKPKYLFPKTQKYTHWLCTQRESKVTERERERETLFFEAKKKKTPQISVSFFQFPNFAINLYNCLVFFFFNFLNFVLIWCGFCAANLRVLKLGKLQSFELFDLLCCFFTVLVVNSMLGLCLFPEKMWETLRDSVVWILGVYYSGVVRDWVGMRA